MNPKDIIDIKASINTLRDKINVIESSVKSIEIYKQDFLIKNASIPPATAVKISYDSKGLVVGSSKLEPSDLPDITIDMIKHLRIELDKKNDIPVKKQTAIEAATIKKIIDPGVGSKVRFNSQGQITATLNLIESDIPELSIDKIKGLRDILTIGLNKPNELTIEKKKKIHSGTFTKLTVDEFGTVLSGSKLTDTDIPQSILNRLDTIETKIDSSATQESITPILMSLNNKITANHDIKAGTFTKVVVDVKGLITQGSNLELSDLPDITIDNISNLKYTLNNKADRNDFTKLNNRIAILESKPDISNDIISILEKINSKADNNNFIKLLDRVTRLEHKIDSVINRIPNEHLLLEINEYNKIITDLIGKISVLEQKLNINTQFDEV